MKFDIITIFPQLFENFKKEALVSRAQNKKIISINIHNLRDFAVDKRGTIDDRPYGGGVGMVLMLEPIYKSVLSIKNPARGTGRQVLRKNKKTKTRVVVFSPKGKKFNQATAKRWSKYDQLIMICGRYEGIDERVAKNIADEEVSIGDYVLFGGEVPAMVVMEAVTRLLPGAIGKQESLEDESFKVPEFKEYPHYTRPEVFVPKTHSKKQVVSSKGWKVPKVLLSGDHKKIKEWRDRHSNK